MRQQAGHSTAPWRYAALAMSAVGLSAVVGTAVLVTVYGFGPTLSALAHAYRTLLVLAAGLGMLQPLVRSPRAALLLSREYRVRFSDTYSAMVVGKGLGGLVPVVPCGVALRCFLTRRLSSVSVAYAAGAFVSEGALDGLGLMILSGFLLLTVHLPSWFRILLLATLGQSFLALVIPVAVRLLRRSRRRLPLPQWAMRASAWGGDIGEGLVSGLLRGKDRLLSVVGLSLLSTALAALQLVLFLSAFGLSTSPGNVALILAVPLAAGNLPVNLPGAGTVSTAAALQIAGVHGAGVAGFLLMYRFVLSSEVTLMALSTLAWWGVTGRMHDLRLGVPFQSLYRNSWRVALRRVPVARRRLEAVISAGSL